MNDAYAKTEILKILRRIALKTYYLIIFLVFIFNQGCPHYLNIILFNKYLQLMKITFSIPLNGIIKTCTHQMIE